MTKRCCYPRAVTAVIAGMTVAMLCAATPPQTRNTDPARALAAQIQNAKPEKTIELLSEFRINSVEKLISKSGSIRYLASYRHNPGGEWTMLDEAYRFLPAEWIPTRVNCRVINASPNSISIDHLETSAATCKQRVAIDVKWVQHGNRVER